MELLQQWLYGNLSGIEGDRDWEAASVVRVIVAGNSVRSSLDSNQMTCIIRQPESQTTLDSVNSVDKIISNWIQSIHVDLMPGEFDPSNYMLPQQPMHRCMFPKSHTSNNFRSVPNPYQLKLADRLILGTSGQNINDIMRYSRIETPLEALELCLRWSHISPTSPDTLPCFPYYENDPFIVQDCPHVFFVGNMNTFETKLWEGNA